MGSEAQRKDGGPAFPVFTFGGSLTPFQGMSLRDWLAGQALCAASVVLSARAIAGSIKADVLAEEFYPRLAAEAYQTADAMLAQRAKAMDLAPAPIRCLWHLVPAFPASNTVAGWEPCLDFDLAGKAPCAGWQHRTSVERPPGP